MITPRLIHDIQKLDPSCNILSEIRLRLLEHIVYVMKARKTYDESAQTDIWCADTSNFLDKLVDRSLHEFDLFEVIYQRAKNKKQ